MTTKHWHLALLGTFLLILVWSGIHPVDRFVWFLEVFPAMVGAVVLMALYPRVKLTMLVYCLIWLHALVLMLGGHWTYAEMPLFNWLRDEFGLARNYYDRLGHVMQGDVWDTQLDMFMALCGAIASQLLLTGTHDRQLRPFLR